MPSEDEIKKISNILIRAITGKISLNCRKKLAGGQSVSVKLGNNSYKISVQNECAVVKLGDVIIVKALFTPWTKVDDDYESMVFSFNDNCEVNDARFQTVSTNYLARFEGVKVLR
jgi:hypothetical protein